MLLCATCILDMSNLDIDILDIDMSDVSASPADAFAEAPHSL